jgi:high affinity Mn2+ porin
MTLLRPSPLQRLAPYCSHARVPQNAHARVLRLGQILRQSGALACFVWLSLWPRQGHAVGHAPDTELTVQAPVAALPWYTLHAQATTVTQAHPALHGPYRGPNSLSGAAEVASSLTATVFAGATLWQGAALFVNPEISAGRGVSSTHGVAGYPNGEIYRVDSPLPRFNWSRLFIQQTWGLGEAGQAAVSAANQLPGPVAQRRLALVLGKFSLSDYFDTVGPSHDARTQFLNWALMDMAAWDYAADTRGYTWGLYTQYTDVRWGVRAAVVLEPQVANELQLDLHVLQAHGDNLEFQWNYDLLHNPGTVRLLLFINHAHMGSYAAANAQKLPPDLVPTRRYRSKAGVALAWEQRLSTVGTAFVRLGLSDGRAESWAFTEVDQSVALGLSFEGTAWRRAADRVGVACVFNGLQADHARFLKRGGQGFILGDGALRYGAEKIVEAYYAYNPVAWGGITVDLQGVAAPGYNRDRGPTLLAALRLHLAI